MERTLNWEGMKSILRQLERDSPKTLEASVLIGGAACWAYLTLTKNPPTFTESEERVLLSKDLDFANLPDEHLPPANLKFPVASLQFGSRLSADDYLDTARVLTLQFADGHHIDIAIADPLDLYREKDAMSAKWNRPQDPLHKRILEAYIQQEILHGINGTESQTYNKHELKLLTARCKSYAPEILRNLH